jgi:SagB-type dehydrogenase family enzyme
MTQDELSYLLWATQWVRDFRSTEKVEAAFRNVPSAGCRHPFETYLLINRVDGIRPGIYYYHPLKHGLVLFKEGSDTAQTVCTGCFDQQMVLKSACTFIWVAHPYRTTWRYSQRGYRYLYLDAGHVGQNLHLAAEAIGGGACMIGAYYDEGMDALLELDSKNAFVIYIASVGKKA